MAGKNKTGLPQGVSKVHKDDPKDDLYEVRLYRPGRNYYRHRLRGLEKARRHADEKRREFADKGSAVGDPRKTVATFMAEIDNSKKLSPYTRRNHESAMRLHIVPALGDVPVSRLEGAELQLSKLFSEVERKSGAGERAAVEMMIRTMLKVAVRQRILVRNPLGGVPTPPRERVNGVPFAPEMLQSVAVYDHVGVTRKGALPGEAIMNQAAVAVLIGTGVRVSECVGIALDDIDFEAKTITLRRQCQYHARLPFTFSPLKGQEAGVSRTLPVPQFVLAAISASLLRHGTRTITLPWEEPEEYTRMETHRLIFFSTRQGGGPYSSGRLEALVRRAGTAVGMPRLHPHSFRHQYTQLLTDNDIPVKVIDGITGHLSKGQGSTSQEIYSRTNLRGQNRARKAIQLEWTNAVAGIDWRDLEEQA